MIHTELIASVGELIHQHAKTKSDKIAFRDSRTAVTYGQLADATANLAGHLQDAGIEPADSVAIFLPNSVEWIESCFGIVWAGAVAVPISYDSTMQEVAYRVSDANCKAIFTTDERAEMVSTLATEYPNLETIVFIERGTVPASGVRYSDLRKREPKSIARDSTKIDSPSFIVYTSGTTGRPKGVLLSQRSMLWVAAACWVPIAGLNEHDYVLSALPLFHSYALNLSVLSILAVGASEYILEKFSTSEMMMLLKSGEFSVLPGVPTMFHYLLEAARADPDHRFSGLRVCLSAGAI
ncbi:MAG: AMP-binding protein, partial [Herbaspirillum sp.]